jgi:hypothetical protein
VKVAIARSASVLPVLAVLAMGACSLDTGGPAARVEKCSVAIAVEGHTLVKRYDDHDWIGAAFIGPSSPDPVERTSASPTDGELTLGPGGDVPIGPYVLIARGDLKTKSYTCSVHLEKLKTGLRPPGDLGVPDSAVPAIEKGDSELLVVMVGPGAS